LQLVERELEALHSMTLNVVRTDNETIFQLHEMLLVKGHRGAKSLRGVPSSLNIHPIDVIPNFPIDLSSECSKCISNRENTKL
jgi:hypothetical protein